MIYKGFIGGAYRGRSVDQNPQTCVNLFPELDTKGGKNIAALYGSPGLDLFVDLGFDGGVRGIKYANNFLFVVVGNKLVKIDSDGNFSLIGVLATQKNPVFLESNGVQLMIVDDEYGYIYSYDNKGWGIITSEGFPIPSSLTYQDGYFIVTEKDTGKFFISGLLDGHSWDATDYATAESNPDPLVRVFSDHRELWLFGTRTVEVFYDSGDADFPFVRINGATQEIGCIAKHSVVGIDNTLIWLDSRGMCVRAVGYQPQVISTRQIEYQWAKYPRLDDAVAFGYSMEGHSFYQINFPAAGKTWIYDAAINEWHERSSFVTKGNVIPQGRHRAACYEHAFGLHLVGDYATAKIYSFNMSQYTDDGEPIIRERTGPVISNNNRRLFFRELKLDFETGVGLVNGQGSNPKAMLQWSNDGGHTWSNEHWAPIGKVGDFGAVVRWKKLGVGRNRVFRVRISDPVKICIINAFLDVEPGDN